MQLDPVESCFARPTGRGGKDRRQHLGQLTNVLLFSVRDAFAKTKAKRFKLAFVQNCFQKFSGSRFQERAYIGFVLPLLVELQHLERHERPAAS